MNKHIGLAAVGNVLDINCWSSTPYHFYKAGNALDFFDEPWSLDMEAFNWPRKVWNLKQWLLGNGIGGYQYSHSFLDLAEQQIPAGYFSGSVISFNQLFPRATSIKNAGGKIYYYIDATLFDLFQEPAYGINIPKLVKQKALALERQNYQAAEGIVVMGNWVKSSLLSYYQLPATKIHHVLPGANLTLPFNFQFKPYLPGAGITRPLMLGFVGKDWQRKGLPVLLDVRDALEQRGYQVVVKAIGHCPTELKARNGLEYLGYINKQTDTHLFVDFLQACDLGCLFSKTEALGISTLEFLRAGVPVIGFYHQGLRDTLLPKASIRFNLQATVVEIANELEQYILQPTIQQQMIENAQRYSSQVAWENSIKQFSSILNLT